MYKHVTAPLVIALWISTGVVQAQSHNHHHSHQHDQAAAHQHGVAQLDVAQDGSLLEMTLVIPGFDIVGFEHAPKNEEQKQAIVAAHEQLSNPKQMVALPHKAACVATKAVIDSDFDSKHDKHHNHGQHNDTKSHQHADFYVNYQFECDQPEALDGIEMTLFEHFSSLHQIQLQAVSEHGQTGAVLTPEQSSFSFE